MKNYSSSNSYAAAGVDLAAGNRAIDLMKKHITRTAVPGVMGQVGGFGSLFELDLNGIENPVLVSSADGVGTKLKLAFQLDRHDTVGIDCVATCVNDLICVGAKPLYFLDYIACGKNVPEKMEQIVEGVCEGCVRAGVALIGGHTAELPGFFSIDEYDLAGYCTGVVDKSRMIDNNEMKEGDIIIALPSSGVHSNGFSLVRRVFALDKPDIMMLNAPNTQLGGASLADTLLEPTKVYVKPIMALLDEVKVKGISHISGGGFYEKIPRSIPGGLGAVIVKKAVKVLPIFELISAVGVISEHDMYNTFNMGVGMTVIVSKEDASRALEILKENGEDAYVIGEVVRSKEKIQIV